METPPLHQGGEGTDVIHTVNISIYLQSDGFYFFSFKEVKTFFNLLLGTSVPIFYE